MRSASPSRSMIAVQLSLPGILPSVAGATGAIAAGTPWNANDWRYYRVAIPSNAPTEWAVGFQQLLGDVVLYLRDTVPPGQGAASWDIRDWNTDRKNHGVPPSSYPSYPSYDAPGLYTNTVPPLRPGHTYYLGFHALNDATFTVFTATNAATIQLDADIAFYGGSVTNYLPPGAHMIYRIIVPPDATRWISRSIHSSEVRWFLDQGSLPTETWFDHVYSGYNSDISLNQYLAYPNNWPWLPNTLFYLAVTNTSASSKACT